MWDVAAIDQWLGIGTLAMQIVGVAFLAVLFLKNKFPDLRDVAAQIAKWGMWIGFLLSLGGSAMTLFYSEILGFAPCGLCWLQRVFLYPIVVLLGIALWKRDRGIADYVIGLSIVGGLVALYQHYLQMGGADVLPCPATISQSADCASRFFFEFGYITFPFMAATLFAFLIILMVFARRSN